MLSGDALELQSFICYHRDFVGIGDVPEEQGIARNRHTCGATVLFFDYFAELSCGDTVSAYFHKSADYCPYHISQEPVGCDCEYDFASVGFPFGMADKAVVGFCVCMQLAEACKVGMA